MSTVADVLTDLVRQAAAAAGHADAPVPLEPAVPTGDPRHGDYQSNHAFRLGKALRTNPRALAETIRGHLPAHPAVAEVTVAGPGFLNFRLDDAWLAGDLARRVADPRLGGPLPGQGRSLVIDYSSPNVAKRMHVGHLRSTIIGNALDRMYRYLGFEVVADNHIGDWGTPFGMLIVAWHRWRDDAAFAADPVGELQRLYQLFRASEKEQPELGDLARAETAKLQAGDAENRALWARFVRVSLDEFQAVYDRLGIRFDVTLGESFYEPMLADTVTALRDAGLAVDSEGAVVVPFGADDGRSLADTVLVIRKRDGAATYGTTDVATLRYREATWDPERVVYVTDVRQKTHFEQLFCIARKLGIRARLEHVWFGMLRLPDGAVAASRASGPGGPINLVDVLDEAARRARPKVDERSAEIPEAERAVIAEAVGVGAVKYADLSQNPQSDIIFEWDRMLSLEGNTAPYLMYAHARCRSILRNAEAGGAAPGPVRLEHPLERELALVVARLPEVILSAAELTRPNLLCEHLYQTATVFSRFYAECRVLQAEPGVRASRLTLVLATARALALGLDLVGLKALERM